MCFFDILEKYKGELIIVDAGRSTTLATAFILEKPMMKFVKEYYIMGGAFFNAWKCDTSRRGKFSW